MEKPKKNPKQDTSLNQDSICLHCKGTGKNNRYVGQQYNDGPGIVHIQGFSGFAQVTGGYVRLKCRHCNGAGKLGPLTENKKPDPKDNKKKGGK